MSFSSRSMQKTHEDAVAKCDRMLEMLSGQMIEVGHKVDKETSILSVAALGFLFTRPDFPNQTCIDFLFLISVISFVATIVLTVLNYNLANEVYKNTYSRFAKSRDISFKLTLALADMEREGATEQDIQLAQERVGQLSAKFLETANAALQSKKGDQRLHKWVLRARDILFLSGILFASIFTLLSLR